MVSPIFAGRIKSYDATNQRSSPADTCDQSGQEEIRRRPVRDFRLKPVAAAKIVIQMHGVIISGQIREYF
jgi:hypothetical protein